MCQGMFFILVFSPIIELVLRTSLYGFILIHSVLDFYLKV